jgi:hypothetical protein
LGPANVVRLLTKSLHASLTDLKLDRAWIVYPGKETYKVHERVEVMPLAKAMSELGESSDL